MKKPMILRAAGWVPVSLALTATLISVACGRSDKTVKVDTKPKANANAAGGGVGPFATKGEADEVQKRVEASLAYIKQKEKLDYDWKAPANIELAKLLEGATARIETQKANETDKATNDTPADITVRLYLKGEEKELVAKGQSSTSAASQELELSEATLNEKYNVLARCHGVGCGALLVLVEKVEQGNVTAMAGLYFEKMSFIEQVQKSAASQGDLKADVSAAFLKWAASTDASKFHRTEKPLLPSADEIKQKRTRGVPPVDAAAAAREAAEREADKNITEATDKLEQSMQKLEQAVQKVAAADKKITDAAKKITDADKKLAEATKKKVDAEIKAAGDEKKAAEAEKKAAEDEKKAAEAEKKTAEEEKAAAEAALTSAEAAKKAAASK